VVPRRSQSQASKRQQDVFWRVPRLSGKPSWSVSLCRSRKVSEYPPAELRVFCLGSPGRLEGTNRAMRSSLSPRFPLVFIFPSPRLLFSASVTGDYLFPAPFSLRWSKGGRWEVWEREIPRETRISTALKRRFQSPLSSFEKGEQKMPKGADVK